MKYSLVLISLLCITAFGAEEKKAASEVTYIPPVKKAETITIPNNTTINVSYEKPKKALNGAGCPAKVHSMVKEKPEVLTADKPLLISVVGQGVAPVNTNSPAQAYALAKRAATADAYRLIAEKIKGVNVDGQDLIKNMMVKRSTVRTSVQAMVRNANIVETTFKDGLCEVEMEITLSHADFAH